MIGIFDSTIGGLAIAGAFEQLMPDHSYLYLGDIVRAPCYFKNDADTIQYSIENTQFLLDRGAEIVVIGCNSAASVATETLRRTFDIPVFEIITPAAEEAARLSNRQRIGIIGTHSTISRNLYSSAVTGFQPECKVFSKSCPLLVPLVEEGWVSKKETKMILKKYLYCLKNQQLDTLILGCTHYSLLKQLVQLRIGRKVTLIDPAVEVVKHVKRYLEKNPGMSSPDDESQAKHHYFVTGLTETTDYVAAQILKRPIQLQLT